MLLGTDDEEGDDFLIWRRMPRRTWSGGVVDADMEDEERKMKEEALTYLSESHSLMYLIMLFI